MRHDWPVRVPRPVRATAAAARPARHRPAHPRHASSPSRRAARPRCRAASAPARRCCSKRSPRAATPTSSSTSAAASAATRWPACSRNFRRSTDPRTGRPLMERTVIIANTSNMPVAAREASIYSAITVAEYFRDQGLHVALMADSTSPLGRGAARGVRPLRRAARRRRLSGLPELAARRLLRARRRRRAARRAARGSVTVIGAISPPSGDFSEPVTIAHQALRARRSGRSTSKRAQARFYPAIHPLQSYSEDARTFAPWWTAQGISPVDACCAAASSRCSTSRRGSTGWRASSARTRCRCAQQLTLLLRRSRQRGVPAAVGVLRNRPRLLARAAGAR